MILIYFQMGPASLKQLHGSDSMRSATPDIEPARNSAKDSHRSYIPKPEKPYPAHEHEIKTEPPLTNGLCQEHSCTSDVFDSPARVPNQKLEHFLRSPELMRHHRALLDVDAVHFANDVSLQNKSSQLLKLDHAVTTVASKLLKLDQVTTAAASALYAGRSALSEDSLRQLPEEELSPSERIREWQRKCMESNSRVTPKTEELRHDHVS